jgi:hypothetical protein
LCLCGGLFAAPPLVELVDGEPFAAELTSIDAAGQLTFAPAPSAGETASAVGPRLLALDNLVRWSHPPSPQPQALVLLADGTRLVTAADWSGGAAVRLEGETLLVLSDTFRDVRLPVSRVGGLVFANRSPAHDRQRIEDQVRAASGEQDEIWLTNQDRLTGRIKEFPGGSLTLAAEVGDAQLPLSRIEAIVFGSQRITESNDSRWIVGLRDGSLLHAAQVEANASSLEIRLAGATRLAGGTVGDVASLQSLGGRIVYLSDLEPADYRHVPYLEIEWPYRRDRNVLGEPLAVGGQRYLKGLGMHSAARLSYPLDGQSKRFDAAVAIDDSAGGRGSVVFGVYVLGDGEWQAAYTSEVVRGGDEPQNISVDVAGAKGLTLTVDYADRGDELDHANWLDARFVE